MCEERDCRLIRQALELANQRVKNLEEEAQTFKTLEAMGDSTRKETLAGRLDRMTEQINKLHQRLQIMEYRLDNLDAPKLSKPPKVTWLDDDGPR